MPGWQKVLAVVASNIEKHFDELKYRLEARFDSSDPIQIIPYYGYGTQDRVYLKGRVLQTQAVSPASEKDGLWDNLLNTYRRLESDEVPGAHLVARMEGVAQAVTTDDEGFFEVWLEPTHPLEDDRLWHPIELQLLASRRQGQDVVEATGSVLVPPAGSRFGIISDIDDTVVQSHATQLLRMARTVFLGNARTRLPFPGVAAFYRALHKGVAGSAVNPLFYVSSGPWNLYDLLVEFFQLQSIPAGPIFLRDWGVSRQELLPTRHREHKLALIRQILQFYHQLPFILIGDSGQEDPEIYQQIVEEYPNRILAVYIRNVSLNQQRSAAIGALMEQVAQAGSVLILADDTFALAQHAVAEGWIPPQALAEIKAEKEYDEAPPGLLERALEEDAEEPAIIVTAGTLGTPVIDIISPTEADEGSTSDERDAGKSQAP